MNFSFWIAFIKISQTWRWVPRITRSGWPLKEGGKVWYFNFAWLNFGFQLDNEW